MQDQDPDIDIAGRFLAHVQKTTGCSDAYYASKPVKVAGGYDTRIFRFRLDGGPKELSKDLVLRVYPSPANKVRARREACVQKALAKDGLPVPEVRMVGDTLPSMDLPFMVMDYIPGKRLLDLGEPESSLVLGRTQATLHDHNVDRIVDCLARDGIRELFLSDTLNRVEELAQQFSRASKLIDWLTRYCPDESTRSIIHGDFHKMNILQEQGRVTGILDWSGFAVMEPAYDVATTQISFLILAKHLITQGDFDPVDLDLVIKNYRAGYAERRDLDETNFEYYLMLRGVKTLFLAASGHSKPYQHPLVISDLCDLIKQISGIEVSYIPGETDNGI